MFLEVQALRSALLHSSRLNAEIKLLSAETDLNRKINTYQWSHPRYHFRKYPLPLHFHGNLPWSDGTLCFLLNLTSWYDCSSVNQSGCWQCSMMMYEYEFIKQSQQSSIPYSYSTSIDEMIPANSVRDLDTPSVTLSHCHTVTLSHCHSVTLSHCHTVTLWMVQVCVDKRKRKKERKKGRKKEIICFNYITWCDASITSFID